MIERIFRLATREDIVQIFRVRNSVLENRLSNPDVINSKDCEAYLFDRGKGWVCEIGNRIVGFSIVDLEENNVWALFVDPSYEKMGIGKELHKIMVDWYFSQKQETLWLSTGVNTRAVIFYQKNGWALKGDYGVGEIKFEMDLKTWQARKSKFF